MSDPDYDKVNFAYMSVPDMDKQTFCELYVNNQPELLNEMALAIAKENGEKNIARNTLRLVATECIRSIDDQSLAPIEKALSYIGNTLGKNEMILTKLKLSGNFSNEDINYIMSRLK